MFRKRYANVFDGQRNVEPIAVSDSELFPWDPSSTYIQEPPFLLDLAAEPSPIQPIRGARVLAVVGRFGHDRPHFAGRRRLPATAPPASICRSTASRRSISTATDRGAGNDRVMARGTFANIRIRNHLAPGTEGGVTRHLPDGQLMPIYDAAMKYKAEGVPLVVLAGAEYGTGSSRDWAAKGPHLLGVRAVIASSFERIHRSNLVGMGILPLQLPPGQSWETLGLSGEEVFDIPELDDALQPGGELTVRATAADGAVNEFRVKVRIDTPVELDYYRNGGILQTVLRKLAKT